MEYLEDKTDTGPLEDGLYRFKCIKHHKGPYTSSDPEYNGSSYNLLIEWEPGEQTLEPLSNIIASDPYTCAVYAKEHNLLNTPCRILGLTALNSLLQYVNWLAWDVCSVN